MQPRSVTARAEMDGVEKLGTVYYLVHVYLNRRRDQQRWFFCDDKMGRYWSGDR